MTLTIELPEQVAERAARWSKEALAQVAVDAVVNRLLAETMDYPLIGEYGEVTEEIPMDAATHAALQEARADYEAGRYCSLEELDTRLDLLLADWKQARGQR